MKGADFVIDNSGTSRGSRSTRWHELWGWLKSLPQLPSDFRLARPMTRPLTSTGMITLADPLHHARSCFADRVAVVDGERAFTYRRARRSMRSPRRRPGRWACEPVIGGAAGGERPPLPRGLFGLPAAGIVLVPLNTRLAPAELAHIVQHSGARALITDRDPGTSATWSST